MNSDLGIIIEDDNAPDTKVKASFTEGWGLFASRDFKEGEVVVENINTNLVTKFNYINHSRKPNCKYSDGLVITVRDIVEGAELFIDYRLEPRPNRTEYPSWI
jgi:SET domain-containing protein